MDSLHPRPFPLLLLLGGLWLVVALAMGPSGPVRAQDSPVMQEIDRQQEQLLRALQERQRRLEDRRSDQRMLDRREDLRREDMRREDMRREDMRRDEEREAERRRQIEEDERREQDRRR